MASTAQSEPSPNSITVGASTADSQEAAQSAQILTRPRGKRYLQTLEIWFVVVFGIPFIILAAVGGLGASFESGDASAFACGLIIAGIGENVIELAGDGFSNFRKLKPGTVVRGLLNGRSKPLTSAELAELYRLGQLVPWIIALAFFGWNLYIAAHDKAIPHPTVDWVQIVVFVITIHYAVAARFIPGHMTDFHAIAVWAYNRGYNFGAKSAVAPQEKVVADCVRALGPDHPDTLAARSYLARWIGEAGNPAAARDQYTDLLATYEQILGPDHPDTLTVRSNLAYWIGEAGNPAAARDQYTDLLATYEKILGPDHPGTLTVRNDLAYLLTIKETPT